MKFRWKRILVWILLAIVAVFAIQTARHWNTIQRVFLGGVKVYETTPPAIPADLKRPAMLVFSKTNGFRHEEAIPAANAMFADMARQNGWGFFQTENGAAFSPEILSRFDAVVFNNVSGDVFTPDQRQAFKGFIENGGGFVGLHAAGDSSHAAWDWYTNQLIGAHFTQHTMKPQFQKATVKIEDAAHPATKNLPQNWQRTEEWYSFDKSPRGGGAHILATVDEKSYNPEGMFGKDLRMGDHPAVWSRCIGKGRVLYSIMGHQAEAFAEPEHRKLLQGALNWVLRKEGEGCDPSPAPAATEEAKP